MNKTFITLCFLLVTSGSARAALDQKCLSLCVQAGAGASSSGSSNLVKGGTPTTCLHQCSYSDDSDRLALKNSKPVKPNHKLFDAPIPLGGQIILTEKSTKMSAAKQPPLSKNFQCQKECLANGLRFEYCDQHCSLNQCQDGSTSCSASKSAKK